MRKSTCLTVSLTALVVPYVTIVSGPAEAAPAYKASEVIEYFSHESEFGAPRGLCIGTKTECASAVPERPKPVSGFDLKVNFDYNSANLTSQARVNLDEFAAAVSDPRLAGSRFLVEGHTDSSGGDAFNLNLSKRRASSVVEYLIAHGVGERRLEAKGYGKQKPLIPSDTRSRENRRVETRLRTE